MTGRRQPPGPGITGILVAKPKPVTHPKPSSPPPMCPITGDEDFSGFGELVVLKNGEKS